jgi:hypothetical protein
MISLARIRRVTKSAPVADATTWPAWTDDYRWEPVDRVIGTDSMGADVFDSDCAPEPDESDEEWLARLEEQEEAEKARVLATYQPTAEDLRDYEVWSQALDAGTLPPADASHFTLGEPCFTQAEQDAIRRCQVSHDELCMMAAGMAI